MNEKLTIIFTNWKRKTNLKKIIDRTFDQTYVPNIIVVDNASELPEHAFEYEGIEIIKKSNTKKCWERWLTAVSLDSEYICIMDDDLIFVNDNTLENCIKYMNSNPSIDCIGSEGVKYDKHKGYWGSEHTFAKHQDFPAKIIKGRFMFFRRSSLDGLDLETELTCDDIKASAHFKTKILPHVLVNSFRDLPQGSESLSAKSYQNIGREYAAKRYF